MATFIKEEEEEEEEEEEAGGVDADADCDGGGKKTRDTAEQLVSWHFYWF